MDTGPRAPGQDLPRGAGSRGRRHFAPEGADGERARPRVSSPAYPAPRRPFGPRRAESELPWRQSEGARAPAGLAPPASARRGSARRRSACLRIVASPGTPLSAGTGPEGRDGGRRAQPRGMDRRHAGRAGRVPGPWGGAVGGGGAEPFPVTLIRNSFLGCRCTRIARRKGRLGPARAARRCVGLAAVVRWERAPRTRRCRARFNCSRSLYPPSRRAPRAAPARCLLPAGFFQAECPPSEAATSASRAHPLRRRASAVFDRVPVAASCGTRGIPVQALSAGRRTVRTLPPFAGTRTRR